MAGLTGEIGRSVHRTAVKVLKPGQEPALTPPRPVAAQTVLEKRLKLKDAMQTTVPVQVRCLSIKT